MKIKKIISVMLCAVLLFGMTSVLAFAAEGDVRSFSVGALRTAGSDEPAPLYWQEHDGSYYLFLPAEADRNALTVSYDADRTLVIGGAEVASGAVTDAFAADSVAVVCGSKTYPVIVMQSSSPSLFVTTESGSMDAIHADKEHKEPGSIVITTGTGEVQYSGALDYIKGRGNSTWDLDKKPYNIKLFKKANLFGMGKAKKWCLLAGHGEGTKLRNDLGYSFSQALGNDLTSDVVMTNLYCNGVYMGAYSLTEKVEIGENRIDIYNLADATEEVNDAALDSYSLGGAQGERTPGTYKYFNVPNDPADITGGYLIELEKILRYESEPTGFSTPIGQTITIKEPENASQAQSRYIFNYYKEFEEALYSPTGRNAQGRHYTDYIDLEELAAAYLVQEFTENFDGCSSSFYLYKNTGDAKFHIGPTWDLDLALGNGFQNNLITLGLHPEDPSVPYVFSTHIANSIRWYPSLLGQALNHADFITAVKQLWQARGLAAAQAMLDSVDAKAASVRPAVLMDAILWRQIGAGDVAAAKRGYSGQIASLKSFITNRIAFMNDYLSNETGFVRYVTDARTKELTIDRTIYHVGETATVLGAADTRSYSDRFLGWTETPGGTTVQYQPGDTITPGSGKILYAVWDESSSGSVSVFDAIKNFFNMIKALIQRFFAQFRK
ncbi:MAG: CotH kinase family protein [Clostridia bacterium]|nr:CotH kinase family protein [Clostridia bacterium]